MAIISPTDSYALFIPVIALPLIDAFLIPGWVRRHNAGREAALAAVASVAPLPEALDAAAQATPRPAPQERPADLRTRILRAAHRGDGRLTVTQAVMETEADFEEVEKALHALVTAGHIDVGNDPDSGVVLYLFPELVGRASAPESGSQWLTCAYHPVPTNCWKLSGLIWHGLSMVSIIFAWAADRPRRALAPSHFMRWPGPFTSPETGPTLSFAGYIVSPFCRSRPPTLFDPPPCALAC